MPPPQKPASTPLIRSIADLPPPEPVEFKAAADCFVLDGPYRVEFNRCDTAEKILSWVLHLSEKVWFTRLLQQRFIVAASKRIGLDAYNAA